MTDIKTWWSSVGAKELNAKIIDLVDLNLGYVPIANLLTEEELSNKIDKQLIQIQDVLSEDGLNVQEVIYKDGSKELRLFIK